MRRAITVACSGALALFACTKNAANAADAGAADLASELGDAEPPDNGFVDGGISAHRGIPMNAPWLSFYGSAAQMGDLQEAASAFRLIDVDVDPGVKNFTAAQITTLKNGGRTTVLSYLNVGACEMFRSYWSNVPAGFVSCSANTAAQIGPYGGYPDEVWMNVSDPAYQTLIVEYVAPRLVAAGADGFFLDNLELVEHGQNASDGPCDAICAQGGLDLVRMLRAKYPDLYIVMQNATGNATRLGFSAGIPFPTLLDGVSAEEVYQPYSATREAELVAWQSLGLVFNQRPFSITTEDYVGDCTSTSRAQAIYDQSRARGFSPYVTISSADQNTVCYWPF